MSVRSRLRLGVTTENIYLRKGIPLWRVVDRVLIRAVDVIALKE